MLFESRIMVFYSFQSCKFKSVFFSVKSQMELTCKLCVAFRVVNYAARRLAYPEVANLKCICNFEKNAFESKFSTPKWMSYVNL